MSDMAPQVRVRSLDANLGEALHKVRKNSNPSEGWEGHDFSRAVKSLKMCPRFSARDVLSTSTTFSASCSAA